VRERERERERWRGGLYTKFFHPLDQNHTGSTEGDGSSLQLTLYLVLNFTYVQKVAAELLYNSSNP
jgi:hypothetical protein